MSSPPPPGPHVDQGPTLMGVAWSFTVVSTIFVALRYYCRVNFQLRLWWDDLFMMISLMFAWAMTVTWTVYVSQGGTSYAPMTPEEAVDAGRINWISQPWCILALATGKLAVAALILRLQAPSRWRTWVIWTLCVICVVWNVVQVALIYVQCSPTEKLWNPTLPGTCWSPWVVVDNAIASCSYMAFMDLALAAIPLHMIWDLKMPLKRKLAVGALLSTGIFAFAMAVVKVTMLPEDLSRTADFVRTTVLLFVWNALEVNVVIIAGCMPTIVPIFEILRGRNPDRYSQAGKHSGRRLLFSKTAGQSSSSWSNHAPTYKSSVNDVSTTTSSQHAADADNWDYPSRTPNAAYKHDVEMQNGIQVTRQVAVDSHNQNNGFGASGPRI